MIKLIKGIIKTNNFLYHLLKHNHLIDYARVMGHYYYSLLKHPFSYYREKLSCKHVSLTVGSSMQLNIAKKEDVYWHSNNRNVTVSEGGKITALKNAIGAESQATITALKNNKRNLDTYYITIVDWEANKNRLKIIGGLPNYKLLSNDCSAIYFSIGRLLYKTIDSFKNKIFISKLPVIPHSYSRLLNTPKGYFLNGEGKILHTMNFKNWKIVHQVCHHGLMHSFDFYYDKVEDIVYVYSGEYSVDNTNSHKVYRGTITSHDKQEWETIIDFESIDNYNENTELWFAARHVHVVSVDPYTGTLWVSTGDSDIHSKIIYSTDSGNSFEILGMGSQEWRTLSIWYTEDYIYWNMDTHEAQKIFRVNRKDLKIRKSITPRISATSTRDKTKYLVVDNSQNSSIKVNIGEIFTEKKARQIRDNVLIALDDNDFDFREVVAELANGSHWSHCWITDTHGKKKVLMAASPEGNIRDMQGRVFEIYESYNKRASVQELISVCPRRTDLPYERNWLTLIEPILQDSNGIIYFSTRNVSWQGVLKAKYVQK